MPATPDTIERKTSGTTTIGGTTEGAIIGEYDVPKPIVYGAITAGDVTNVGAYPTLWAARDAVEIALQERQDQPLPAAPATVTSAVCGSVTVTDGRSIRTYPNPFLPPGQRLVLDVS